MKKLLAITLLLVSVTSFAKSKTPPTEPTATQVVDAMALANPADVAEFLKSGNRTTLINYKAISANEELFTMLRQSCTSNGLGPSQCLGGTQIQITLVAKISMANRFKVGSSKISVLRD